MPVEIRELIIQAKVTGADHTKAGSDSITLTQEDLDTMKAQILRECMENSQVMKKQIIRECMQAVEELLENKKLR